MSKLTHLYLLNILGQGQRRAVLLTATGSVLLTATGSVLLTATGSVLLTATWSDSKSDLLSPQLFEDDAHIFAVVVYSPISSSSVSSSASVVTRDAQATKVCRLGLRACNFSTAGPVGSAPAAPGLSA